jgi:hypothetical protein
MKGANVNASVRKTPYRPREPVVVTPLSGPCYGVYNVVRRSWRKPLPAIIADATTISRALLTRLDRGMYMPSEEDSYRQAFNDLYQRTQEQIKALDRFSQIDWRE